MKITKEWLKTEHACTDGLEWFSNQKETNGVKVVQKLMCEDKFNWANWLIVRLMNREQKIRYSIFAAELVIKNYEKLYPENKAPRKAIESAKLVLENDTKENISAAYSAASAADSAADSASSAAYSAAYSAASAAYSAADSASSAAYSAASAASAAYSAADSASSAADSAASAADSAAYNVMKTKIIEYGIKLLKGKK